MKFLLAIAIAVFAPIPVSTYEVGRAAEMLASDTPIPASYFGMTMNGPLKTPWPSIGFGSLRTWDMNISWSDIAVERGRYDWDKFDAIVDLAASHGIELVYTFGRTPRWAARAPDAAGAYGLGQCSPPAHLSDWEDFVRAVVARAAGRIKFWEIWNEPQDRNFYCGDIPMMVMLQKAAYAIVKQQDSELQVLTPSPTGGLGPSWMWRFLSSGGGDYADIIGFHGYWDADALSLPAVVSRFKAVAQARNATKPMWDTEAGWGENPPNMDPTSKAAFLAKYYLLHWSLGIRRLYWYSYDNELGWGTLWDQKIGLLLPGLAYHEVRSWMVDATMSQPCAADSTRNPVWTCGLVRPGGYHALAIWAEGPPRTYRIEGDFPRYRNLAGERYTVRNGEVTVTASPILLESGAR
jgi:polysaccharide biosynthesis protein PslG